MIDRRLFKGETKFSVFKRKIDFELNNIKSFIEEISEYIKERQAYIEKSYDSVMKDLQEESDEETDPNAYFDDETHKYHEVFPKHYFNPLLLSLFGLFENWLKRICNMDSNRGFSKVKVIDLAGSNYIEKSRKYLSIVADLNLNETERDWQKIKQIQKIRNAIAHNDSNIKTDHNKEINRQELYLYLKDDNRIVLNENIGTFYIKDKEYLYEVIELINRYLNFVISKLSSRKVVAKNSTMPYNNDGWGQEKMEHVIDDIINCLDLIDEFDNRKDEQREDDLRAKLSGILQGIIFDATKIYAFFCDGNWEVEDRDVIMKERRMGFERIKEIYKR